MINNNLLTVEVKSNLNELSKLLSRAYKQATILTETIEEIEGFQLEIKTELVKAEKKTAAPEVSVPEQPNTLTPNELECIARHIMHYVKVVMDKKENVPDPCESCKGAWCKRLGIINGKEEQILDPWPAFIKLANLANFNKLDDRELQEKVCSGHTYP